MNQSSLDEEQIRTATEGNRDEMKDFGEEDGPTPPSPLHFSDHTTEPGLPKAKTPKLYYLEDTAVEL